MGTGRWKMGKIKKVLDPLLLLIRNLFLTITFLLPAGCCCVPFTITHIPVPRNPLTGYVTMLPSSLNRGGVYFYNPLFGSEEGSLYAKQKGPIPQELKRGEACAQNYGYFITSGDASIPAAADAGGIKKIYFVDYRATNYVLGFYAQYCVIVWGE